LRLPAKWRRAELFRDCTAIEQQLSRSLE